MLLDAPCFPDFLALLPRASLSSVDGGSEREGSLFPKACRNLFNFSSPFNAHFSPSGGAIAVSKDVSGLLPRETLKSDSRRKSKKPPGPKDDKRSFPAVRYQTLRRSSCEENCPSKNGGRKRMLVHKLKIRAYENARPCVNHETVEYVGFLRQMKMPMHTVVLECRLDRCCSRQSGLIDRNVRCAEPY